MAVGCRLPPWLTLLGFRPYRMFGLGPPTVLRPLLSTRVRAWLDPPTLGTRVRLDLCRRPHPTMSTWAGPLDSRLGPAGVPNGRLTPVEVRNVDHHTVMIDVNVQGSTISLPRLRQPSTSVRRIDNGRNVVLMTVTDVTVRSHGRSPVPDPVLVRLSTDRLPPLVGNDLGHTGLTGRPLLHVLVFWTQLCWLLLRP